MPTPSATSTPAPGFVSSTGWGGDTLGGSSTVHVTNLLNSGTGSLRAAIATGKKVVFDVGGTIALASNLYLSASNLTIDGSTAPSPITISGAALVIDGSSYHDIVIKGIRIRDTITHDSEGDGIRIKNGAYNIHITQVSISQTASSDSAIDITKGAHDVTVDYSILHNSSKGGLINYGAYHVSYNHNIFVGNQWRNPNSQWDDNPPGGDATQVVSDVSYNTIWGWGNSGGGSIMNCGTHSNVVKNVYKCNDGGTCSQPRKDNHIVNDGCAQAALFYTAGNVSYDTSTPDPNSIGNHAAYTGPTFSSTSETACDAAHNVYDLAGVRPLDATDTALLATITLPAC